MSALAGLLGLDGKVALVTGAGNGIAQATARYLAVAGCAVVVVDIDRAAAEQTAESVREAGAQTLVLELDLTADHAADDMVQRTVDAFGGLDVAINVFGGTGGVNKPFLDLSEDEFLVPMERNLMSTFRCAQAQAIAMIRGRRTGSIINVSSTSGVTAAPRLAGYGAANAAVIHLTKTAAIELAPYDVRVNCLVPGSHRTKGTRAHLENPNPDPGMLAFFREAAALTPLARLGEPEDAAGVNLFLASKLSGYLTGHAIASDGGLLNTSGRPVVGGAAVPEAIRDVVGEVQ